MIDRPLNAFERVVMADDFRELERCRLRSLVERNLTLARQLHSVDFQLVAPNGRTFSRDQYLGDIEGGRLVYFGWDAGKIDVRMHASVTLLRYQATLNVGSEAGQSSTLNCWHTDSYELLDGLWKVVWSHATAKR
ncbi:MAG TPA: nuclear transport factor 2 family protein [Acidobacteriaceae bacterium]|nr:nuclear transport factor 2 family protein [Acidobacteriaceae bacterium]